MLQAKSLDRFPTAEYIREHLKLLSKPATAGQLARSLAVSTRPKQFQGYLRHLANSGELAESHNINGTIQFGLPYEASGLVALYAPTIPSRFHARQIEEVAARSQPRSRIYSGMRESPLASVFLSA